MNTADMQLPEGKTCNDCLHFMRVCRYLVGAKPEWTTCDFAPSRYWPLDPAEGIAFYQALLAVPTEPHP